jgi:uncharacterized membrane protein HdeD (DUF308 family)
VAKTTFFEARNWWVYVLRGIAAIAFGVLCWAVPGMVLLTLLLLFAAYAIVDGILAFVAAFSRTEKQGPRPLPVAYGFVSIGAGLIAAFYPGLTTLALLMLLAARAIITGALEIVAASHLQKEVEGEWLLVVSGGVSIAFGVLLFLFPGAGALGLILWIGAWAIILGALLIVLGIKLLIVNRGEHGRVREKLAGSH